MQRMTKAATNAVDAKAPLLEHSSNAINHDERRVQKPSHQQQQQQQQPQTLPAEIPLRGFHAKLVAMLNLLFVTLPILLFVDGLRLFFFVIFLAPAFAQFVWYYFVTSDRIVRRYSPHSCRTTLDIYGAIMPSNTPTSSPTSSYSPNQQKQKPVLLFFPGGAWLIGYKMWGALLAKAMASDYLVVICDYRNYSIVGGGATVPTMVQDVHDAIVWTLANCETFGGDSRKVVVVGQSAGGHLCACVLLRKVLEKLQRRRQEQKAMDATTQLVGDVAAEPSIPLDASSSKVHDWSKTNHNLEGERIDFDPIELAGFVSLSAPFHLEAMKDSLARHGLGGYCDQGLVDRMFGFKMKDYDPQVLLSQCCNLIQQEQREAAKEQSLDPQQQHHHHYHHFVSHYLPPVAIFHGTGDKTVPYQGSRTFYRTLAQLPTLDDGDEEEQQPPHGCLQQPSSPTNHSSVQLHLYTGWSHTDPILEGLFDGDHRFHSDLNRLVRQWTTTDVAKKDPNSSNGEMEPISRPRDMFVQDSLATTLKQQARMCPHMLISAARFVNPF